MTTDPQARDRTFGATIAEAYERHLVPLIFEPYAATTAGHVAELRPRRVLEIAAGTGVLTRALSASLPQSTAIIATDLSQAMLDQALAVGTSRPVEWRQADALALPVGDATADVVVCQFGVMFFPDKRRAFAEARRALAPGGTLVFSVWDRIEENEFADVVTAAVAARCPDDPPSFLRRVPHGYFDPAVIAADVRAAGFEAPARVVTVAARSRATSPRDVAIAYCQGTPLRTEIEAREGLDLTEVTRDAAATVAQRFGSGAVDGKTQAHLVAVTR